MAVAAAVVLDILVLELTGILGQVLAGNHSTQVQGLGWARELLLQILDGLLAQLQLMKKFVAGLEQDGISSLVVDHSTQHHWTLQG